ncbi:hypothetical protein ALI144C_52525 [Actinosynnema sp. ALI-1.44]|uniref:hypothetical protein n=1 Tax=Actinosynnema sp. ALI-1.44 TaxID=1933779 RepID=UPI00097C16B3|nr:hypothetical protein [Actinosynnema sp. ALI-1.44]ONI71156.1 hypothetical protein ALI144C_52525 [Actinosynnema sp. ALI-1.44]
MNTGPWSIACRDVAGRERTLRVVVRDSEVVVTAPPGEVAVLCRAATAQFRSAVIQAAEVATTPAPGAPGPVTTTGTVSTAEQNNGGLPPTAEGRPALLSYRGGTTTPIPGSAAIPVTRGEAG